jgi:hypothetical protein
VPVVDATSGASRGGLLLALHLLEEGFHAVGDPPIEALIAQRQDRKDATLKLVWHIRFDLGDLGHMPSIAGVFIVRWPKGTITIKYCK